jgi:hypothetical protein
MATIAISRTRWTGMWIGRGLDGAWCAMLAIPIRRKHTGDSSLTGTARWRARPSAERGISGSAERTFGQETGARVLSLYAG